MCFTRNSYEIHCLFQAVVAGYIDFFIPSLTSYSVETSVSGRSKPSSSIGGKSICKCKHLTTMYVSNSSINSLSSRLLGNCQSLEILGLSNNKIREIAYDTFSDSSNLFILDLSNNQITTLPKDVFKALINLRALVLNRNRMEIIDSQLFFHNQNLFHLDISDNSLRTIEPKSFRTMKSLNFLNMYNNPSLNDTDFFREDLRELQSQINMANCGFTKLFIPLNISAINAAGNKINEITAHPNSTLISLRISRNNFTNLSQLSPLVN